MRPVVLTIAGSDGSGGSGIQADVKSIEANGAYAAAVPVAITVQNTLGVHDSCALEARLVRAQLDAVLEDLPVRVVKTGMLANAEIVAEVAGALAGRPEITLVVDPVIVSSGGRRLLDRGGEERLRETLLPRAAVVTPNVAEAEWLAGGRIEDADSAEETARRLLALGAGAVLLTGGHRRDRPGRDLLVTAEHTLEIPGRPIDVRHGHGSGCVHASALAAFLSRGFSLAEAAGEARQFVSGALRHGLPLGRGTGPVDPCYRWTGRDERLERTR